MKRMAAVSAAVSIVGLALALAACGSKEQKSGEPKTMDEVKEEAAQLQRPRPGQYTQKVEITKMDVPGMPSEAAAQMKTMMAKGQVNQFCLTQAEADKGYRDMFDGIGKGRECSYSRFEVDGGKLDAQMECKSADQGTARIQLAGTVSDQGSDVTVDMNMSGGPAPMGEMKMAMHMTTARLGDCP
ncbi:MULTISPECIES: DUF3617 domain-containing protein [Sphingomonadaceae]|uniref:DUF3617 domain-containing protein n=1 Tax=Sphingomonadaceae TaxID=41297 RepID=UPI001158D834|nr:MULTISPECIES: DUF3617 domain-containing protein [Sphingomonadaceae]QDK34706.1 DUF3617 domain-containing protein [Sphingomonas sp. IC081]QSR16525.1 hypothetical protein CA833_04895 [Novosphingobium sp. KA1]